jgi:pimeloyl-ACP methyl ester carboxylesterase
LIGHAPLNDVSLYYEVHGHGSPLVLIHGWTLNCRMWDDQLEPLAAHHCVIRYDRRGFGRSTGEPATERDATDLDGLVSYLGLSTVSILAMSQGGWAALYFALEQPHRTTALILNATVLPGFNLPFAGEDRVPSDRYMKLATTEGMSAMREAWLGHPFFAIARTMPRVSDRLRDIVEEYSGLDLAKVKSPAFGDARDAVLRIGRLTVPTLILIGEADVPYMKLVAQAQAYAIPDAKIVTMPGCDHLANMEDPAGFNCAVLGFLAAVEAGSCSL